MFKSDFQKARAVVFDKMFELKETAPESDIYEYLDIGFYTIQDYTATNVLTRNQLRSVVEYAFNLAQLLSGQKFGESLSF